MSAPSGLGCPHDEADGEPVVGGVEGDVAAELGSYLSSRKVIPLVFPMAARTSPVVDAPRATRQGSPIAAPSCRKGTTTPRNSSSESSRTASWRYPEPSVGAPGIPVSYRR
jgi:hypothetical protein